MQAAGNPGTSQAASSEEPPCAPFSSGTRRFRRPSDTRGTSRSYRRGRCPESDERNANPRFPSKRLGSGSSRVTGEDSNLTSSARAPIAFGTAAKSGRILGIDYSSSGPDSREFVKRPELQSFSIPGVPNSIRTHNREVRGSPPFVGTGESSPRYLTIKRHRKGAFLRFWFRT
jgi:hypothetical protein